MKAAIALVRREFLEHRHAFLTAPAVLVLALFLMILAAFGFGHARYFATAPDHVFSGTTLYAVAVSAVFAAWTLYLMIALGFYYADSFSADRRNNSLLFWKSMPQSDLTILGSKALAGITVFPALIFCFAMITGLLVHFSALLLSFKLPFIPTPGLAQTTGIWLEKGVCGAIFMVLTILWYAPVLTWIAALSTVVQRWAIPLAILIPGAAAIVEGIVNFGAVPQSHPIRSYLAYRLNNGILDDKQALIYLANNDHNPPFGLVGLMLGNVDWLQMGLGLAVAALLIYVASEYRRRKIDA